MVDKEVIPVERVRLVTQTTAGEQKISEQLRKELIEQVDVDGQVLSGTGKGGKNRGRTGVRV